MLYWDTSALLKLYVSEPDSPYFLDLIAGSEEPILSCNIAEVEVLCALYRKEQAGDLKTGAAGILFEEFLSDLSTGRILSIPYGMDTVEESRNLINSVYRKKRPLTIRSLDVIHLASALLSKAKSLVTTDGRLREAAKLSGLQVLP